MRMAAVSVSKSPIVPRLRTKCPLGYWESNSHESIRTVILKENLVLFTTVKNMVSRLYNIIFLSLFFPSYCPIFIGKILESTLLRWTVTTRRIRRFELMYQALPYLTCGLSRRPPVKY